MRPPGKATSNAVQAGCSVRQNAARVHHGLLRIPCQDNPPPVAPKVELHQHVDGSDLRAEVTWELDAALPPEPRGHARGDAPAPGAAAEEEGTLLAYLDKMHYPLWITQFYENISQVTEAIVDEAAAAGVTTLELRYSPVIHTFAGPHAAAVDPRRALGHEPRAPAAPDEAGPRS